jgi:archaemetzincin
MTRRTLLVLLVAVVAFAGCARERPAARGPIVLVPIGAVPAALLQHLRQELPKVFHRHVIIADAIPLPRGAFDASRRQYRGDLLLDELSHHDVAGAERVVGVIDADAYAPGLNFILGQAKKPGRFAVVALARLHESFLRRPDNVPLLYDRAVKTATHELGHTFGFEHCDDSSCVMHFANAYGEIDRSGFTFCPRETLPDS